MLNHLLLASAESSINHLLQLDPATLQQLAKLSGQVLEVQCTTPLPFTWFVIPHAHGIQLASHWEAEADCRLAASLAHLTLLATAKDKTPVLHNPAVELTGNTGFLMQLAEILQQLDLDWEYRLQQWIGPAASGVLGATVKRQHQWFKQTYSSLEQSAADYAAEEARFLVGQAEAEVRFDEISQLNQTLNRLEARLNQLAAKDPAE